MDEPHDITRQDYKALTDRLMRLELSHAECSTGTNQRLKSLEDDVTELKEMRHTMQGVEVKVSGMWGRIAGTVAAVIIILNIALALILK